MSITGTSILNDVIGPVMRGPSSSHTAGPFFIGKVVRHLLGGPVRSATITFDLGGSFAHVYSDQKSDVGFAAGLLDMGITDEGFHDSLNLAHDRHVDIRFVIEALPGWSHPNTVRIHAQGETGKALSVIAESIGGGQIQIVQIDQTPLRYRCHRPAVLWVRGGEPDKSPSASIDWTINEHDPTGQSRIGTGSPEVLASFLRAFNDKPDGSAWPIPAIGLIAYHQPAVSFSDVAGILRATSEHAWTLADLGVHYESQLLNISPGEAAREMTHRWGIMKSAVQRGLSGRTQGMRFLTSTSIDVRQANRTGRLVCGGLLAEASAAALAVMEQNSSGGVVCAAPTAGSAGIIPGLLHAIQEQRGLSDEQMAGALYATGVIGVLISTRATFAAETCACAAETGAAAAMAAAALVDLQGGTVAQSLDAATMCLMNTIGLACDPVQGAVEIPCHARNLAGVAHALVAADSILGGFRAVLPLDQTIDAMLHVGRSLPASIRCTSTGGLAATPAAKALVPLRVSR